MDDNNKLEQIYRIISQGDLHGLQHFVSKGYNVNNERFLIAACIKGHLEIVKYILSLNTVYSINTLISKCIKYKQNHILLYILELTSGYEIKQKPLNLCVRKGYIDIFKLLLDKKKSSLENLTDYEEKKYYGNYVSLAIKYKELGIVKYLFTCYNPFCVNKFVSDCIWLGRQSILEYLIYRFKYIISISSVTISNCIITNKINTLKYLFENYKDSILDNIDIELACEYKRLDIIKLFIPIRLEFIQGYMEKFIKNIYNDYVTLLIDIGVKPTQQCLITCCTINDPCILKLFIEKGYTIPEEGILQSCQSGYINIVKTLMENGYKFNNECLKKTCGNGYLDILKELINHGAVITIEDNHCLKYACLEGLLEVVKLLFSNGADPHIENGICLDMACLKGCLNVVIYLVSKGMLLKENLFDIALKSNNSDLIMYLLQKGLGSTRYNELLVLYVEKNNIQLIRLLIELGANVNYNDNSPIILAVRFKNIEVTRYLISKGAKVNEYLLKQAINSGSLEITKLVIDNSENLKDENYEFVKLAIDNRSWSIVEYILDTYYGGKQNFVETCEIDQLVSTIRKKFKLHLIYIGPITDTTERECGICLQEMDSSTEELLIQCEVCKKCTHLKCSNIWNKTCIYCRN